MKVVEQRKYFLSFSATLVVASLFFIFIFGFKQGIDLKGGTKWQISFPHSKPALAEVKAYFQQIANLEEFY